jgi:hypothetical protein
MTGWLELTDEQRRATEEQAAIRSGINAKAIEKDWWVTLTLKALFQSHYSNHIPGTKKGLTGDGFNVSSWIPQLVSQRDINSASQIITFDCTLPVKDSSSKQVVQWNGIPAISKGYNLARNQILEKVQQLINKKLAEEKKKPKKTE